MTKYCCYFCSFLGFQAHYSALISHLSAYLPHHLRGLYTAVAIGVFYQNANVLREPEKTKKNRNLPKKIPTQYPDPGSNRDGLPHWCLRPARLPIPPSGRLASAKVQIIFELTNFLAENFYKSYFPLCFVCPHSLPIVRKTKYLFYFSMAVLNNGNNLGGFVKITYLYTAKRTTVT